MPTWFNWSPVAPLIDKYHDDGSRDLCTAEVSIGDTGEFKVSVIGTPQRVEMIRVATLAARYRDPPDAPSATFRPRAN
jgi:hypothetical protein